MARQNSDTQALPVREPSVVASVEETMNPQRRERMDRFPTISPARSAIQDGLTRWNPPTGPRASFGDRSAFSGERNARETTEPEFTIKGTAAAATAQSPIGPPTAPEDRGLNDFQRRVLTTLAKGYAPRTGKVPAPPRTLRHSDAMTTGENRLFTENYGGNRQEDLALCKWVFDTEKECPNGKECTCRHEPLDDEELEWIRTNPVPPKKNIAFHPGKWLERLLQNYSNPRMPKVSKFDRT